MLAGCLAGTPLQTPHAATSFEATPAAPTSSPAAGGAADRSVPDPQDGGSVG